MKILVLDNYDSFTYNLVHYVERATGIRPEVKRNDKISIEEAGQYDRIVLSPGPGLPEEAGILMPLIQQYAGKIPILGVCLGHQAIAQCFGGKLRNLDKVFHGVGLPIKILIEDALFDGISDGFVAGRYHSWVVEKPLPEGFTLLAEDENQLVMAFKNEAKKLYGVQFHPESILTEHGEKLLANWFRIYDENPPSKSPKEITGNV